MINGLIQESIQVVGRTYYYLPRHMMVEDPVLGEDALSKFQVAIPIEMYMLNNTGFAGDKEMFSKFGLEIRDSYTLVVSKDRWEKEIKTKYNNGSMGFTPVTSLRPQEGDLVYDPLTTHLMEIRFCDHDVEFFQLGKNYMYHLSCEAFQYSQEKIETGISAIDQFETDNTLDIMAWQMMTEDGNSLILEMTLNDYLLQEFSDADISPARKYGTDYSSDSLLIEFNPRNPFGDL